MASSLYGRQQQPRPRSAGLANVERTYMNVMQAAAAQPGSPVAHPAVMQSLPGLGAVSTPFVAQIRSGVPGPTTPSSASSQSPRTLPVVPQSQEVKRFHKEPSYSTVLHSHRSAPSQAPTPHLYANYNPMVAAAPTYASSTSDYAELDRLSMALDGSLLLDADPSRQSYASPPSPVSSSYSELRQATKFPPGYQMQKYLLLQQQLLQQQQPADSIYEPVTQQYDYTTLNRSSSSSESGSDSWGPCFKCRNRIVGEFTGCEVKVMNRRYHIQCFTCHHCHCQLQGRAFFPFNSRPYCEECHLNTLEKCCKCLEPITDRILRATGKPYHPQCFTCIVCNRSLDGIQFTVDATNQIHCIEDFHRRFAPKCSVCKEPIMPKGQEEVSTPVRVVALDRSFHIKCYRCEDCNLELYSEDDGRGCYPLDGHVLCKRCNTRRIQELTSNLS